VRLLFCLLMLAVPFLAVAQEEIKEPAAPPVLSRGAGPGLLRQGAESVRMRVYANVENTYETGLSTLSLTENGEIPEDSSYGIRAGIGAYGYHRWRRSLVGLDYRGNFSHYTQASYYDGSDHALSLGLSHQATKRTYFTLRQMAGTASRDIGTYSPYGFADPTYAQLPAQELFNNRVYYFNTMGDMTYQKSSRLSFNLGGSAAMVKRRSSALVGNTAEYARADMMYRVSRRQTIGLDYGFSHYSYTRGYGYAYLHMGALNYAARMGRSWTFSLRGGVAAIDTQGLIRVDIDPVIAVIIGRSYGVEIYDRQNMIPSGGVTLQRQFRKSSASISYTDGAVPGNGLYLASRNRAVAANYSYNGIRRWNFGASFDYSKYSSLSRELSNYQGYGGGVGATCELGRGLHLTMRVDTRDYEIQGSRLARNTMRATLGLAYTSGDGPLSLW